MIASRAYFAIASILPFLGFTLGPDVLILTFFHFIGAAVTFVWAEVSVLDAPSRPAEPGTVLS